MRRLGMLLAVGLAVVAGVASASAVVGGDAATSAGPDALVPDGRGASLPVTAADPDGRAPWAVRVYTSKTGLACAEAGRSVEGRFGRVDRDGTFVPLSLEAAGSCVDLADEPLSLTIQHYPAQGKLAARAVLYGVVSGKEVVAVSGRFGAVRRSVPVVNDAYILVLREDQLADAELAATLADGSTKSYKLHQVLAPPTEPAVPEGA